jgi:hypothetical protein
MIQGIIKILKDDNTIEGLIGTNKAANKTNIKTTCREV